MNPELRGNKRHNDGKDNNEPKNKRLKPDAGKEPIRVTVLDDGNSLLWSITLAYLIPAKDNIEDFSRRFTSLFGQETKRTKIRDKEIKDVVEYVRKRVKDYHPSLNRYYIQSNKILKELVEEKLRERVLDYIKETTNKEKKDNDGKLLEDTVKTLIYYISANGDSVRSLMTKLKKPVNWRGLSVIETISRMLDVTITVTSGTIKQEHQRNNGDVQIRCNRSNLI